MKENRKIDSFLNWDIYVGKICFKAVDLLYIAVIIELSLVIRIKLFPIKSADYTGFLEVWMEQIRQYGPWKSLSHEISNYPICYMYLMSLVSGIENTLYSLKTISVIFDYAAAVAVFGIIYELTKNTRKSVIGMSIFLLCPTVFIDSAYWCQCDIIYTCFILWALFFYFKGRGRECCILVGFAFCFKLQAVFILPFLIVMWLKNNTVKFRQFIYIPLVYIVMQLPAVFAGRPFKDLILFYFSQANYYPWGTLNYPNVYALLDEAMPSMHYSAEICGAGSIVAVCLMGILAYYLYTTKFKLNCNLEITIALFFIAFSVYTLPHMHERYGFLIDVLAIIYVVLRPKKLPVLAGFMLVSLVCFMPYLVGVNIFELKTVALIQGCLVVYVGYDLYKQISLNIKMNN